MGKGKVEMKYGNQIVAFRLPTFGIRQNGRRSVTLRIQRGNAIVGEPDALEVTFPRPRLTDETPKVSYRIDVFASPAQGDMFLANSGESFARLTGTVSLSHFGTEPGDPIEGRLESELFRFLPKEKKINGSYVSLSGRSLLLLQQKSVKTLGFACPSTVDCSCHFGFVVCLDCFERLPICLSKRIGILYDYLAASGELEQ